MKFTNLIFLFALLFSCSLKTKAQVPATAAAYTFTATTAPYTYLTGGTPMPSTWVGDDNYASVPIGFSFNFCGTTYTNVSVANNGFLSFATLSSGAYFGPTSMSAVAPVLMPFWANLDGTTQGSGMYLLSGTAPNRVFTFEWQKWGVSPNATAANQNAVSFQVRLYENGFIEYLYKQEANAPSVSAGIGISRTSADYILLTNNSSSPVTTTTAPTTVTTGMPATGQLYRFSFCITPSVLSQPQPVTKCSGDSAVFQVNANGTAVAYQWQVNNGTGFNNLSATPDCIGVNTAQLTVKNLPNSSINQIYRAVLTGNCAATVNTANATYDLRRDKNICSV